MKKLSGTIEFRDVEMGLWLLKGDDGVTYVISGGDRKIKKDGARVEVEGDVDADSHSIAVMGPKLVVRRYEFK